jgi:membrane protease YdiL (CAAX protease family)
MSRKKDRIAFVFFLTSVLKTLFIPYVFEVTGPTATVVLYVFCTLMFAVVGFYISRINRGLFTAVLFFALLFVSYPLIKYQQKTIGLQFPGVMFAVPVLVYFSLVVLIKKLRSSVSWLRIGSFDRITVLLIAVMTVLTGAGLLGWVFLIRPDLNQFIDMVPSWPLPLLILGGFGFALSNALVEEFMYRGVLWDGLSGGIGKPLPVILIQAGLFGLWHFRGFPGGLVGVVMVFAWGIFLGLIRKRSRGIIAPIVSHILADLTIFFILLLLVKG